MTKVKEIIMQTKKAKVRYVVRGNCKQCYGRGTVLRTLPKPARRVLCGCVKVVKAEEKEGSHAKPPRTQRKKVNDKAS